MVCDPTWLPRWFHAEEHFPESLAYARAWTGARDTSVLDAFGFSARMACLRRMVLFYIILILFCDSFIFIEYY